MEAFRKGDKKSIKEINDHLEEITIEYISKRSNFINLTDRLYNGIIGIHNSGGLTLPETFDLLIDLDEILVDDKFGLFSNIKIDI